MHIIKITPLEGADFHPIQSQSHRNSCWLDGYIAVPEHLVGKAVESSGFCHLVIQDDILVDIEPRSMPEPAPREPTPEEDREGMLVDHEYRLTLLELGVSE